MKTPHGILIGLSLMAAAIFFKDMPIRSAQASFHNETRGFSCLKAKYLRPDTALCFLLTNKQLIAFHPNSSDELFFRHAWDLKSGKPLKEGTLIK